MPNGNFSIQLSQASLISMQEADKALARGDIQTALNKFSQVIQLEKATDGAAFAYFQQANIYSQVNYIQEAINSYQNALQYAKDVELVGAIYFRRGMLYRNIGKPDEAISDMREVIKRDKNSAESYNILGNCFQAKGMFQEAITEFTKAIAIERNNYIFYLNRGMARQRLGDIQAAYDDFNQAVQLNANDADNFYYRATILHRMGQLDKAIEDFDKAIKLDSNDPYTYSRRAEVYLELGDNSKAIDDFQKALNINPAAALDLNPRLATAYNRRAIQYTQTMPKSITPPEHDIYDLALADLMKAIKLAPNVSLYYLNRGMNYQRVGLFTEALDDFNQFLKMGGGIQHKNESEINDLINKLMLAQGTYFVNLLGEDEKLFYFLQANNLANWGNKLYKQGKYKEALRKFIGAINLAFTPNAYIGRGHVLIRLQQYQQAISDFQKLLSYSFGENDIQTDTMHAEAYYGLALCFLYMGNKPLAKENIEKALQINPKEPQFLRLKQDILDF
jgi:tetratricopeptide (TPR) repeat protein